MMTQKIVRWAGLSVLFVVAGGFWGGQTVLSEPQAKPTTVGTPLAGRYQIFYSPHMRADTFLLDTETGKTWGRIDFSDLPGKPTVWMWEDRVDDQQELNEWYAERALKKTQ